MSNGSTAVGATGLVVGLATVAASFLNSKFKVISEAAQKALLGVGAGATVVGGLVLTLAPSGKRKEVSNEPAARGVVADYGNVVNVIYKGSNYIFEKREYTEGEMLYWATDKSKAYSVWQAQRVDN